MKGNTRTRHTIRALTGSVGMMLASASASPRSAGAENPQRNGAQDVQLVSMLEKSS